MRIGADLMANAALTSLTDPLGAKSFGAHGRPRGPVYGDPRRKLRSSQFLVLSYCECNLRHASAAQG